MEEFADLNERLDRLIVPIGEGDVLGKRTSVKGWESVEIRESGERLVDLAKDERLERFLILSPQYYQNFRKNVG